MGQQTLIQRIGNNILTATEQNGHQKVAGSNAIPLNYCRELTYNSSVYLAQFEG